MQPHIARWDLDKTYLRTEFDTMRDLVRAALERPDEKRTNPGASTLLREMRRSGVSIHILSGSPEQMRKKLEHKLRLDGIVWDTFILKPNLRNILRFRFRAMRDQLGYKLPSLLAARAFALPARLAQTHETLFGDDAEADAFVYSLYADVLSGKVDVATLEQICMRGRMYDDVLDTTLSAARQSPKSPVVERILIHLERQTAPESFNVYGTRVVPFYNYLQAAFVVHEDGRVGADGVVRVAEELVRDHRFGGAQLVASHRELASRGHVTSKGAASVAQAALAAANSGTRSELARELEAFGKGMDDIANAGPPSARLPADEERADVPDYPALVLRHNRRSH